MVLGLFPYFSSFILQNRLLAMNYINEGHDDKLFEAHRFQLITLKLEYIYQWSLDHY